MANTGDPVLDALIHNVDVAVTALDAYKLPTTPPTPGPTLTLSNPVTTVNADGSVNASVHATPDVKDVTLDEPLGTKITEAAPVNGIATFPVTHPTAGAHTYSFRGWDVPAGSPSGHPTNVLTSSFTVPGSTPVPPNPPSGDLTEIWFSGGARAFDANYEADLDKVASVGATGWRDDSYALNSARTTSIANACAARHLKFLCGVTGQVTPAQATSVATALKGKVYAYEMMNEPDLPNQYQGSPYTPAAYWGKISATLIAIHAADPAAHIILPATSNNHDPMQWQKDLRVAAGRPLSSFGVTGYSYHPYEAAAADFGKVGDYPLNGVYHHDGSRTNIWATMQANGDGSCKLYLTEDGCRDRDGAGGTTSNPTQQATNCARIVTNAHLYSAYVAATCIFTVRNDASQDWFGLWEMDGTAHPAVAAVKSAIAAERAAGRIL